MKTFDNTNAGRALAVFRASPDMVMSTNDVAATLNGPAAIYNVAIRKLVTDGCVAQVAAPGRRRFYRYVREPIDGSQVAAPAGDAAPADAGPKARPRTLSGRRPSGEVVIMIPHRRGRLELTEEEAGRVYEHLKRLHGGLFREAK